MRNMDTPNGYADRAQEAAFQTDDDGARAITYALLAVAASIDSVADAQD
jgi:Flp pilus assembly pilin Flp